MVKHDVRLNSPNSVTATNGDVCCYVRGEAVDGAESARRKTQMDFTPERATKDVQGMLRQRAGTAAAAS